AHDSAGDRWEPSSGNHGGVSASSETPPAFPLSDELASGSRVGAYVIGRKIGEGGMGSVFEGARADQSYEGRVAIKTLRGGFAGAALARRFLQERQILARLQHPNIASLFDGGTTDRGAPYLVMEFVDGVPIDAYCDAHRLSIAERLDLFRQVCAAIQFAHQKLIVHRDIKPGNIMVTRDGIVKVLDFGVAKLLDPDIDDGEGITRDGLVPLTHAYASPEQARGDEITTATDVYSLGVVLYRLLAGTAPYDIGRRTPSDVRAIVSTQTPALPSVAATDAHARACGYPGAVPLRRALSRELDAIVMLALRKEADRRYPSVAALSDDMLRYLKGQPVVARPDTLGYRLRTMARRQRAMLTGSAIAIVGLVTATVVSVREAQSARDEARRAQRATQYLQALVGAADPSHYSALRTGKKDVGLMEVLDSARRRVGDDLTDEPRIRADLYWSMGNTYRVFGRHQEALTLLDSARLLHTTSVGDASVEVARDVHFIGIVFQDIGRFDEAITRFREARARYAAIPAAPDSEVTDVLTSLGQLLGVAVNQFQEGELLLRDAEQRELARPAPRHAMAGLTQSALGTTLMQSGAYSASDSAFRRAVESYDQDSVRARFERSYALVNWGMLQTRMGRLAEAVTLKRRALSDMEITIGPDNISTVRVQQRLADDLLLLGRLAEARAVADSALDALARLATSHPLEWSQALRVRGAVAARAGDAVRARVMFDSAATYVRQLQGGSRIGPEIALLSEYGRLHERSGDRIRAESSFRSAYEIARDGVGASNPLTLAALGRLAAYGDRIGDSARARAWRADSARDAPKSPR
ncbi:MAG: serine/threonine-protein kinase, partial [Gemmatimonas sp.]